MEEIMKMKFFVRFEVTIFVLRGQLVEALR
jgi:hypothetical protein